MAVGNDLDHLLLNLSQQERYLRYLQAVIQLWSKGVCHPMLNDVANRPNLGEWLPKLAGEAVMLGRPLRVACNYRIGYYGKMFLFDDVQNTSASLLQTYISDVFRSANWAVEHWTLVAGVSLFHKATTSDLQHCTVSTLFTVQVDHRVWITSRPCTFLMGVNPWQRYQQ